MTEQTLLVDTSVAVPLVLRSHDAHETTIQALDGRRLGLAGHAWFETFSVLTRLPPPARRGPREVTEILEHNFPDSRFLSADESRALTLRLADAGAAGGAVYDALVGHAAATHRLPLATRDHRAVDLYRALGAEIVVMG